MILLSRVLVVLVLLASCRAQVCSSLIIPLNVFTRDGLLVRDISPDHLLLKVHGEIANIESFSLDASPRRVVLLLDTSGSMAGNNPSAWKLVPELGSYALDTIPPNASVSVGTIGETPNIGEFGDRAQAGARALALTRKSIKGRTPLLDSIHLAVLKLGQPSFGDVIYLVTDGGDTFSKFTETQIERELLARGTRIFVLLVDSDQPPRTEEQRRGPELMGNLVQQTGGHLLLIPWNAIDDRRRSALLRIAPLIESDISTSYRIQLSLPKPIEKMTSLQIRYTGPDQRLAKDSAWIYPHRVGPCPH